MSSVRAGSMSRTTRCRALTEPGGDSLQAGRPAPSPMEHADPGGVSCTTRSPLGWLDIEVFDESESLDVERLRPVDVGNLNRDQRKCHLHNARRRDSTGERERAGRS